MFVAHCSLRRWKKKSAKKCDFDTFVFQFGVLTWLQRWGDAATAEGGCCGASLELFCWPSLTATKEDHTSPPYVPWLALGGWGGRDISVCEIGISTETSFDEVSVCVVVCMRVSSQCAVSCEICIFQALYCGCSLMYVIASHTGWGCIVLLGFELPRLFWWLCHHAWFVARQQFH